MDSPRENHMRSRPIKQDFDRLSDLPIDTIYHILSFCDTNDIVQTSLLSKRWRYIWKSVPNVSLDFHRYKEKEQFIDLNYGQCVSKFWNFVYWSLVHRDAPQVNHLRLCCDYFDDEILHLLLVILNTRNVQELEVHAEHYFGEDKFSPSLFEFLSGVREIFDNANKSLSPSALGNLKSLSLVRVEFSDPYITEIMFSDFGVLEKLSIQFCRMSTIEVLNISSRKLKEFRFVNLGSVSFLFRGELKINAPNLEHFGYSGSVLAWEFSDLSSLTSASIDSLLIAFYVESYSRVRALVSALHGVKEVSLPKTLMRYFSIACRGSAFNFQNLRSLNLDLICDAVYMEGVINLLKWTPNITGLHIRFIRCFETGQWKSRKEDLTCLSHYLREVEVTDFYYSANPLEFVKFLIENGKVLEKMQIVEHDKLFSLEVPDAAALPKIKIASKLVDISVISLSGSGQRKTRKVVFRKKRRDVENKSRN